MPDRNCAMASRAEDPRVAAVRALRQVLVDGGTLTTAQTETFADPRDAALSRAIAYGVLRMGPLIEARLATYLRKPLKPREAEVKLLLMAGLYQLGWMRLPDYAAIAATVEAARKLGKHWATGLANGVLRAYQRDGCPTTAPDNSPEHVVAAHPAWLYQALKSAWPESLQALIEANNTPAPMWLRLRGDRQAYIQRLADAGIESTPGSFAPQSLSLAKPMDVAEIPGFEAGEVSVQDAAAQLAAGLLDAQQGMRVLDACAAPGGKTAHLLESQSDLDVTALDVSAERSRRIEHTLKRLDLSARVIIADAGEPDGWWDSQPFDRILLDAPCSGSGVIRRHPDIKVLRRAGDIPALAQAQRRLLDALWQMLAQGGSLLYATCSILPAENDAVISGFLADHSDAEVSVIDASWGRPTANGRQILTGEGGMDGFFYARLDKQ
jgi:16S rRNA (cytosine967-C5)-methyltransferase